ncbi:MAG: 1-acylglycerol-3-phosphate O-acyltransferase [Desulfobacterales bacterium]|nr:1-acylglycerol-3-phosphate O-acyltransferase [Desulfobacterales bacterium]
MNTLLKIAYQPYKWFIVIPFMILNTMILGTICIIVGFFFSQDAADIVAVTWSRLSCAFGPVMVKLHGKKNYSRFKSYVVVANHQSMVDIPVIHGFIGLKIKWVMKQELRQIPVFGAACTQLGCIYVDRSNHEAAVKSIEAAKKKMSKKASVLFFAEGTRTRDGSVMPFKKGAFIFAMATGTPILPVTIKNSMEILPSDTMDLTPGTVDVIVHRPVHISPHHKENLDALIEQTRQTIASAI